MKINRLLAALLFSVLFSAGALADTLLIERVHAQAGHNLPTRGQSMARVQAQFGAPSAKQAPVGGDSRQMPKITRWDYPGFSVYFENSHVVDAVLAKASSLEIGPAPARRQ